MHLTKLEHAALILEESGRRLFVDPGAFTTAITDGTRADAIVITHEHPDHWTREQLDRIVAASPGVRIFAPAGVAAAVGGDVPIVVVGDGDTEDVGPFRLRFFGRKHAVIHESIPVVDNVGVLVNDSLYYGGDSFTIPDGVEVDVLAAPAGAPWMKIAESIDYVLAVKPRRAFPTHEMVLSRAGKDMANQRLAWATERGGGTYFPLEPGESLDI
jgi:L-ascorbate metabolism protein UlaG (beta-lactamase superfamily)